jgi:hypothetical protein
MRMPGFNAEASLYNMETLYRGHTKAPGSNAASVVPSETYHQCWDRCYASGKTGDALDKCLDWCFSHRGP